MNADEPQPYRSYRGWYCYVNYTNTGFYWLIKDPTGMEIETSPRTYPLHFRAMEQGLKRMKELANDIIY